MTSNGLSNETNFQRWVLTTEKVDEVVTLNSILFKVLSSFGYEVIKITR